MIVIDNFPQVAAQIEKERGISKELLLEAISAAMIAATRKKLGKEVSNLEVDIDGETGEAFVFAKKEVVKEIKEKVETEDDDQVEADSSNTDEEDEEVYEPITLEEAKEYQEDVEVGDIIMIECTPDKFGRIAAQTAKQVIMQKIREAEKKSIYQEFKEKEGKIFSGYIQRKERNGAYLVNLGRIESLLSVRNQIPKENYNLKDRIRVYIVSVEESTKGPQILISRAHSGLIKALFELEIPEIQDGIIEIIGVSRDVGSRAKVAVRSNDPEIGAVGTCVGHMGGRIQNIVKELGNERIDIIEWSEDQYEYIANSLKPAKINKITLEEDEEGRRAIVNVDEDQLSLAIGKGGQNVRLAARLVGWKIDIESQQSSLLDNLKSNIAEQQNSESEELDKDLATDDDGVEDKAETKEVDDVQTEDENNVESDSVESESDIADEEEVSEDSTKSEDDDSSEGENVAVNEDKASVSATE